MEIDVNELADYYANFNLSFAGIFEATVQPGNAIANEQTTPGFCGIVIPLGGCACFTIKGTPYVMRPGMIVHTGPAFHLDKEVVGDEDWNYARIHFRLPENERNKTPFYDAHFCVSVGDNPRIVDMVRRLDSSHSRPDSASMLRCKSLFSSLIEEFILSARRLESDEDALLIEDAISFIHERFAEQISIEVLAAQYHLSRRRFSYLFQKQVGMAPSQYITGYRMRHAKDLLRSCGWTVTQVAECVGFTNAFYFSNQFKQYTGVSPTEFRMHLKEGQ